MTIFQINVLDELFFDFENYLNNRFILPVSSWLKTRKSGDFWLKIYQNISKREPWCRGRPGTFSECMEQM